MARNELEISVSSAFNCNRCPNRQKVGGIEYPKPDLPSCPRDELIRELGSTTPTSQQLVEGAKKYGLIFRGQVGEDFQGTKTANLECPNAEGSVPGILMAEIKVKPRSNPPLQQ